MDTVTTAPTRGVHSPTMTETTRLEREQTTDDRDEVAQVLYLIDYPDGPGWETAGAYEAQDEYLRRADLVLDALGQWDTEAVARFLNVKPSTVRKYHHDGFMPAPDGRVGQSPWWRPRTIKGWDATRPGPPGARRVADRAGTGA